MILQTIYEHQVVQVCRQFEDGVAFMVLFTQRLLNNMARGENCNFETQGHFDGAFNWCNKDFALIAYGMNSMDAHYTPVSISIFNSESQTALEWPYNETCACLYAMYNTARLCGNETCGFCTQIKERIEVKNGTFKNRLASEDATNLFFLWTSLPVKTQFTFSLDPRRNLELIRKSCSADIICSVSLFVILLFPGQP